MRRASVAMNYSNSDKVELAQGVSFSEDNTIEDNTVEENTIKYNIIENNSQFNPKFNSPH